MNRLRTGIPGYDEMLGGGFLPHTAGLVEGAPGTGKTTLGKGILSGNPRMAAAFDRAFVRR